jgi:SAM-dependent methyltransferase
VELGRRVPIGEAMKDLDLKRDKTIRDFGEQWTSHQANTGYYASKTLLADIIEPLLPVAEIQGRKVLEIGSGTGRIVGMLVEAGAGQVVAVEPSQAFEVLARNTEAYGTKVTRLHLRGDETPALDCDLVLSIGVIHHIPNPQPVMQAAWNTLKDGGRCLVWLYGREGNELYLAIAQPLRKLTHNLPVWANNLLARIIYWPVMSYAQVARAIHTLPLSAYLREVFLRFEADQRRLVILDQINPTWAKYYTQDEAKKLLQSAGFSDIHIHGRHGYSWTAIGTKLKSPSPAVNATK